LGEEIPAQWWKLFRSVKLNDVIHAALDGSPTVAAAQATLRQAQEVLNARTGTVYYPSVNANYSYSRQRTSLAAAGISGGKGSIFDLHNASVDVSYLLDIFGGGRRELEALKSQVDYQRFQLEAAYLTLSSNVVTTVVKEASLREQSQAMRDILATQEKALGMLEKQLALGGVARSDVLAQRTQVEQTRSLLPGIEKELSQTRHYLAVLTGRLPSESGSLPEFSLADLVLPVELPVSIPSSLARQRPDIRAAEALLHAASAQIGVATANLYPQITLSGSYGAQANSFQDLFNSNSLVWGVGAGLLQPVFQGGALRAQRRAAIAAYDQTAALYRQTILVSFQNVADVLLALETDAMALKSQAAAETAAHDSLSLSEKQFAVGAVNYLALLNAERQYQQARIGLIQAQAQRFSDTAALFQALGGGWWNNMETNTSKDRDE
jgi:NodT family efflux transporter outer membrane factor (OMF) lipoprotein